MKRFATVLILLLAVLLPLAGQNNPYELDDECYPLFQKAELLVGKEGFEEVNAAFLRTAVTKGDTKSQTLYYIERLKHFIRLSPTQKLPTPEAEEAVLKAFEEAKSAADRFGFPQYYYYAYELVQNFYYNHKLRIRTIELVQEMQQVSMERNDEYGQWMGFRYLVALYISQGDYITAKRYILKALEIHDKTTDPVIKKQSLTRLYCDLADTYVVGTDSLRINVEKAVAASQVHLDTLRFEYYLAKIAAYEKRVDDYKQHRDFCLQDPQLTTISQTASRLFDTLDAIIYGSFDATTVNDLSNSRIREVKYIANVAEVYGYKDQAFEIERLMVRKYESLFSESNSSKITELDSRLGKAILSAELANKNKEMLRIYRVLAVLLLIILLGVILFFWNHSRNLRKASERDEQRIEELKEANEKVRLADAAKTRFVQNMSHEVRTPLNAIVGFSQLLSLPDGTFPPEEKDEFAGHIINNTKMLTMLLDDILNASAMDSGNYSIVYEDGEVHTIAQAAISSAEHRLQPGVQMHYEPESAEPFTFRTDPRRVQQILINLLTNACKHTSEGEIKLSSSLTANPGMVTFTVTDTGPGIPPEEAERIFDRFTKLNDFVQGTGLGLSICRDIASRMNANVYLDTDYTAGGARFVFEVPIESHN